MTSLFSGIFAHNDRVQMASLGERLKRSQLINANVANSETPGYRALGYKFEAQLQSVTSKDSTDRMRTTDPMHYETKDVQSNGRIQSDVYIRPSESFGSDGNTVDMDHEMAKFAENQILYRSAVETIKRKIGMLRYAINGGR